MTRLQNITVATLLASNSNVLRPGHRYQKFKFHQQQEALAAHFDFTSFSAQPFLDSWPQLFLHQGCFGWDSYSYSGIRQFLVVYITSSIRSIFIIYLAVPIYISMIHIAAHTDLSELTVINLNTTCSYSLSSYIL